MSSLCSVFLVEHILVGLPGRSPTLILHLRSAPVESAKTVMRPPVSQLEACVCGILQAQLPNCNADAEGQCKLAVVTAAVDL